MTGERFTQKEFPDPLWAWENCCRNRSRVTGFALITTSPLGIADEALFRRRTVVVLVAQRGNELVQVHRRNGLGEVLWFALAGAVVYALLAVYRHARAY